jgi:hypothetical protein
MMIHRKTVAAAIFAASTTLAWANGPTGDLGQAPPGGDYRPVSELVPLPEFIPGMGQLFVQPDTLPAGPFLAYDRTGRLASTVYMIPLSAMNEQQDFADLAVPGATVKGVDIVYNAGHPGVAEPHYHVVLHHLDPAEAELQ